jgi:hypothetical protein
VVLRAAPVHDQSRNEVDEQMSDSWGVSSAYAGLTGSIAADKRLAASADRPELIRVVRRRPRLRGRQFNLVTPFAGKTYCFGEYLRGVRRLPPERAHAVWYDNSCDAAFRRRLERALARHFRSYTLIEDRNPPRTIETTSDYARVDRRVVQIYRTIMHELIEPLPLVFVVEDDVEVPAGGWERLVRILDENPTVGTAVGVMNSRRIVGDLTGAPVAWNIERVESIGGDWSARAEMRRIVSEKPYGVELIGAAHTGCWLTRTNVIKKLGIRGGHDNVSFVDQTWGYRLNLAGHRMAIDWSVKARHYFLENGRKQWV